MKLPLEHQYNVNSGCEQTLATKLGKEEDMWYKISKYETWLEIIAPGLSGSPDWSLPSFCSK